MDLTSTITLMALVEYTPPATTFLRDRYFPSNAATDVFNTPKVLVEYRDGDRRIAPFVSPRKNGVMVGRMGYTAYEYEPAHIAPKRSLTIDDLNVMGFGEAIYSKLSPADRQAAIIQRDLSEMDRMIARREEAMAAETMLTNGCVMKHYADKGDKYEEMEIHFYDGGSNPAVYTCSPWTASTDVFPDLHAMILMLTTKGNPAAEIIVGSDVANLLVSNSVIKEYLDNRRYELGRVNPRELPQGVAHLMTLNVFGHMLDVLTYEETYEDENGADKPYIPAKMVLMSAPGAGHTAYGCVSQVEQSDGIWHSYAGRRVPKYVADSNNNSRTITLSSAPLLMPNRKNPWVAAQVLS